ncbi:tyrosine-type recombinase/integrase [Methylobacterium sp. J-067]|uniref:tyrosine-type recombinase/integrase n=1 Tax=Methylobacterium sp. J-067 TaxID=2836648 RepID=UPI001FB9B53A|nr:site-specific integrase [Methylobacterium sp. J-067]MCJ2023900.1 integrase arm-type DNA-binding domain-containing protein [Methylobacterium sp. J-067]
MGGKGRHPEKALTTVQVRALKSPGRYADGHGLYLVVDPSGAKRWLLRIVVQGRRRDIGLGGVGLISLAEAREKALAYRKTARDGGDPMAERKKAQATLPTFAEAAELVHAEHQSTWKNPKHAAQWITTLRTYAFPHLGAKRIDQIETPDVLRALSPIWLTKPETARRVRQRIGTVLDWAKAAGHRSGDNPIEGVAKGLPKQGEREEHHAALPYAEVPAFVARLRAMSGPGEISRLAFEFLILTAARTGEVLGAQWDEIDEPNQLWTVPSARMKAGREHRVPLCDRASEILCRARDLGAGTKLVFPGRESERPLSNMVFLMALRRMGMTITAHGFRSSFRDWAAEATNLPREVAEVALAHTIENRVEAAYRRGDLLAKRAELMSLWSGYLTHPKA